MAAPPESLPPTTSMRLVAAEANCAVVELDGEPHRFSWMWIRDHGEDAASLDPHTMQRAVDTFAVAPDLRPHTVDVVDDVLRVSWSEDGPETTCSVRLLATVLAESAGRANEVTSWTGALEAPAPRECAAVMGDDAELAALLDDVAAVGFARVAEAPATAAGARALAERIAPPRLTVFGTMWHLSSSDETHRDSAYSTAYLEPHTDATYMTDAPGTQLFCCETRTGTGGESILVDGYGVAADLRAIEPEAFAVLTSVAVPGRYLEPGVHLVARRPPIQLDREGRVEQVTFNNYDRAPFWRPEDEMAAFYEAYRAMHDAIVDQSRWWETRLEPGDALLVDNWRILHGRRSYTGTRVFHGCYHNRDDILSRRRVLAGA